MATLQERLDEFKSRLSPALRPTTRRRKRSKRCIGLQRSSRRQDSKSEHSRLATALPLGSGTGGRSVADPGPACFL